MSQLTQDQIDHIAQLARIKLTDEQKQRFAGQLSGIFEYIEKLNSVDTSHVEPTAQVTGLTSIARADRAESENLSAELLAQAPQTVGRQLKVKTILEN